MEYGVKFNPYGWFYGLFIPDCIARSSISDSSKLLLGKLFQYAGQNGRAFPSRARLMDDLHWKQRKLDRNIKILKEQELIKTHQQDEQSPSTYTFLYHNIYDIKDNTHNEGTVKIDKGGRVNNDNHNKFSSEKGKELPKGNSPTSGQVSNHTVDSRKRSALRQIKKPTVAQLKHVHQQTIDILAYWNSFDSLTTHTLKQKRSVAPLHEQSKTIKNIDCALYKLLRGTFYSKHDDIQVGLKKKVWSIALVKKAIEHMALACTPDYSTNSKRVSLMNFLFNPHVDLSTGTNKYRYKYPFLHFINNKPKKVSDSPTRKKTEYPILVDKTIKNLTGTIKPTDKEYNQVVKQIDKAIIFIKKVSNGNFSENRMMLPLMLKDTMLENKLPLTVDNLPLGVYNLEKFMRKRLMIRS